MPKSKTIFLCGDCGYDSPKWYGQCPSCGAWNTMSEMQAPKNNTAGAADRAKQAYKPQKMNELLESGEIRYKCGITELDRVLGGGIVKGSLVLVGGDPGIGKSTILLQMCAALDKKMKVLYVTGEESPRQIKLRAGRLGAAKSEMFVLAQNDIEGIIETALAENPDILIIDSIQTMLLSSLSSSPGSVTQVKECTSLLMRLAKDEGIPIFLVGHVNKEGSLAGPKVMEHMVDAVLYFEGDKQHSYRIIRAIKNRYGSDRKSVV